MMQVLATRDVVKNDVNPWWDKNDFDPLSNNENAGRIWHHYLEWEDAANGMYRTVTGGIRKFLLQNAIDFTGDFLLYGSYMLKVLDIWPISCEHNLSAICVNRRAWIGHAACCLAIGVPEDITREAWGSLTAKQKRLANNEADIAIRVWEKRRSENAKDLYREKRSGRCSGENSNHVRPIQQDIFEFLRRKGFYGNASFSRGGSN